MRPSLLLIVPIPSGLHKKRLTGKGQPLLTVCEGELFRRLNRNLPELFEEFAELECRFASASTCGLVAFFELKGCVGRKQFYLFVDLFDEIFHDYNKIFS